MIDCHLHTKLCKHAKGEIVDFIETAIRSGLEEIVFTDHMPLPDNFDLRHRMTIKEMEIYLELIEKARLKYRNIRIKTGIEADYYKGFEEYIFKFLNEFDFDVVIMSIHFLKHWPEENWVYNYNFPGKTQIEIYKEYTKALTEGINTGLFDILGHADVIKSPGDSLVEIIPEEVERIVNATKSNHMAIEINTSGLHKNIQSTYPGFDWFPLIKKINLPITIGSDAHKPAHVAYKFDEVYKQIYKYGIKKIVSFDKRNMIHVY
jgi:histidinol-phosphatase (PHP family)